MENKATETNVLGLSPMLQEAIRQEQERRADDPVWKELYRQRDGISALLDLVLKESGSLHEWIHDAINDRRRLFDNVEDRIAWLERTVKRQEETINRLWNRIGALELAVFPAMEEEDDFFEEAQK